MFLRVVYNYNLDVINYIEKKYEIFSFLFVIME